MGKIRPKECEPRELTKDQLAGGCAHQLIHWPTSPDTPWAPFPKPAQPWPKFPNPDPACQNMPTDAAGMPGSKACRLSTWRALVDLFHQGRFGAIGVSNYNTTHIQEIIDSGLPLPAVNQIPYNPHLFRAQAELVALCAKHNVPTNPCSRFATCARCR